LSLHLLILKKQLLDPAPTEMLLEPYLAAFGVTYRVQHFMGTGQYFLDFAFPSRMLAVEADDPSHRTPERQRKDAVRDAWLRSKGWTIIRFTNAEIQSCPQMVAAKVKEVLDTLPDTPDWWRLHKAEREMVKADIAARKARSALKRVAKAHAAAAKKT
jgi:very-short-patch-repair endonuclease